MILATCLALLIACPGWLQVDNELEITPEGIQFIKEKEEAVLFVYDDLAGYPPVPYKEGDPIVGTLTVGYGHTGILSGSTEYVKELIGETITQEEADKLFEQDLKAAGQVVTARIKRHLKLPNFVMKYGEYTINDIPDTVYDYLVITAFNQTGLNNANILGNLLIGNIDAAHDLTVKGYGEQIEGLDNRLQDQQSYAKGEYKVEEPTPTTTSTTTTTIPTNTTTTIPTFEDTGTPLEDERRRKQREALAKKSNIDDDVEEVFKSFETIVKQFFGIIPGGPKAKGKYGLLGDKISEMVKKD